MKRNLLLRALPRLGILVAVLIGTLVPSTSEADFARPPLTLSTPGQDADSAQVAIDADGDALVVWRRFDGANWRVQARARSAAGGLGPVQILSGPGDSVVGGNGTVGPRVAIDADGDALVVWATESTGVIQARARSAAGVLGRLLTLSPAGAYSDSPEVAIDSVGNAVATWRSLDGTVDCSGAAPCFRAQARSRSRVGALGTVQTLSAGGQNAANPEVAVDPDGDALVVWDRYDGTGGSCCERVQARARSAAGALGPLQLLSQPGYSSFHPEVAVDAAGDALVVWWRFGQAPNLIQARARSAAGTLAPLQRLRDVADTANSYPQVAIDADGDALVVWQRFDGTDTWVETRTRSAIGTLGAVTRVRGHDARVAVSANGDGVVVWQHLNRIKAQTRSVSGTHGSIQVLSNPVGSWPEIAVDPVGHALAVWTHYDGTNLRLQAAPGP